jgi:hypothetical protein
MLGGIAFDLIPLLPRRYRWAMYFLAAVFYLSLPGAVLLSIFFKWWSGIFCIFLSFLLFKTLRESAEQFVLEHADSDRKFFEALNSEGLLLFRESDARKS